MATHEEVTDQIMAAWADEAGEPVETEDSEIEEPAEEEVEQPAEEEAPEEPAEEEPEEEVVATGDDAIGEELEEEKDGEGLEPEEEAEEPEVDPQITSLLAQYGGDTQKALRAHVELVRAFNRQGEEKNANAARVRELEQELERARSLQTSNVFNEEQHSWIEQAVESGNPQGYVQAAVQEGEFGLARAVCDAIAEDNPYVASRLAHFVDQAEVWTQQQARSEPVEEMAVDHNALMSVLVQHFPDMPKYEEQMVSTLSALGPDHPLARDSRSNDPETAARGIIGIFEIARASTATVTEAREKVKARQREKGDAVRAGAVVSSASASPKTTETPRPTRIGPGLTMEQLDEVWK